MTKNVEVTIDIEIARRMLKVAGFVFVNDMTDEEVFEQALNMNEKYAVESTIITLPDMREKVKEYMSELDAEIDRCHKEISNLSYDEVQVRVNKVEIDVYMSRARTLIEVKNDLQSRLDELI